MAPEPAACLALPPQSGQFLPALFRTLGYAETIYVTDDNWLSPTGPFARNPLKTHLTFRSAINGDGRDVPPGTVLQAPAMRQRAARALRRSVTQARLAVARRPCHSLC